MKKINRNDPCHCGSGKKYKQCCLAADAIKEAESQVDVARQTAAKSTIATALATALANHQNGKLAEAALGYQQILAIEPRHFDALNLLGVVAHQTGDNERAVVLISQATSILPNNPYAFNNLGNAYLGLNRHAPAMQCFEKAVILKPDYAEAHNNLANVFKHEAKFDQAIASYRKALAINPGLAEAHHNLSIIYQKMRQMDNALRHAKLALAAKADSAEIFNHLGNLYKEMGDRTLALSHYKRAVEIDPNQGNALHFIASLSGNHSASAPTSYVTKVFDDYADRFDDHLQGVLEYRIPRIAAERMSALFNLPAASLCILDLGCGTGLAGVALAPYARQIVGVDLSANMLQKAAARNLYQRLVQSDLLPMTRNEADASYDVVVAADVFVYVGRLDEIVADVKRILRPNGLFSYSVESQERSMTVADGTDGADGYHLQASGRYAHTRHYLNNLADQHGFRIAYISPQVIRTENGQAISGWLVIWQK